MNAHHSDIQRAINALHTIPADCDRDTWIKVGMASKEAGIGFEAFDLWSAQADSYRAKDCSSAWKSFKEGKGVGAGTLFTIAKRHGWHEGHQPPAPSPRQAPATPTPKPEPRTYAAGMAPEEVWSRCKPATNAHPYITAKHAQGVPLGGLRVLAKSCPIRIDGKPLGGALVIPGYGPDGALQTLQFIPTDGGKKLNLPRAPMSGASFVVGDIQEGQAVYLCEGVGTAWAIWQATGAAAVVCFGWGNVANIAKQFHHKGITSLVLCPDVGKEDAAHAIAQALNVTVVTLPEGYGKNADLWDYAQQEGADALALLLETAPCDLAPALEPVIEPSFSATRTVGTTFAPLPEDLTPEAEEDDDPDPHRNAPRPDPACLYGLVGEVARTAHAANREVNPYAAALGFMVALSAGVGRGCYLRLGDDWHHPRLFALHVGRSGRGRKGTAFKLTERLLNRLEERHPDVTFQHHSGGLSSREGLVMMIHDGYTKGTGKNAEEVPAVQDKRLFILESEFVNVLHQAGREGNTLSAALRDAWDGKGIKPAIKNNAVGVRRPHINLFGHITPSELKDCMKTRELSNGFANRFLTIWAEQPDRQAYPTGTPDEVIDRLTDRMAQVLRFAGADRFVEHDTIPIRLSPAALPIYQRMYEGELAHRTGGERLAGLLERRAPMLLRVAMLLALTDLSHHIEPQHLEAAMAWVRYWQESVTFIFATAQDEAKAEQTTTAATRILDFLHQQGQATRTQLSNDCFQKRATKDVIDTALDELLKANPPLIEVTIQSPPNGRMGRPTKVYKKITAEYAELRNKSTSPMENEKNDCGISAEEVVSECGISPPSVQHDGLIPHAQGLIPQQNGLIPHLFRNPKNDVSPMGNRLIPQKRLIPHGISKSPTSDAEREAL